MALSISFLQTLNIVLGTGAAYFISKLKPVWWMYSIAFIFSSIFSWITAVFIWSLIFASNDYTSAIIYGMPRTLLFSIVGPIIGIVLIHRKKKKNSINNKSLPKYENINSEADNLFYEKAWSEIENGNTNKAIWS